MLVWKAGMNFIDRPLSYASVKLRPFSPVSPTFLPQSFSASLIFLFSPVVVQRAQLCTVWRKTLAVRSLFSHNSIQAHSCFFCSPQTPHPPNTPHPHPPNTPHPQGEGLLEPFLGVHHFWLQNINCDHATVCHVCSTTCTFVRCISVVLHIFLTLGPNEHMSFCGIALNRHFEHSGPPCLRSGDIWGIYRDHWQPWLKQLLRHGVSLYWFRTGQDIFYYGSLQIPHNCLKKGKQRRVPKP